MAIQDIESAMALTSYFARKIFTGAAFECYQFRCYIIAQTLATHDKTVYSISAC